MIHAKSQLYLLQHPQLSRYPNTPVLSEEALNPRYFFIQNTVQQGRDLNANERLNGDFQICRVILLSLNRRLGNG